MEDKTAVKNEIHINAEYSKKQVFWFTQLSFFVLSIGLVLSYFSIIFGLILVLISFFILKYCFNFAYAKICGDVVVLTRILTNTNYFITLNDIQEIKTRVVETERRYNASSFSTECLIIFRIAGQIKRLTIAESKNKTKEASAGHIFTLAMADHKIKKDNE